MFISFQVGIVRLSSVVLGLVMVFLLQAPLCDAASLDTFARVNLVQGMKAEASETPNDPGRFTFTGPENYSVNVQLAPLEADSPWSDPASLPVLQMDSNHDLNGQLDLLLPLQDESAAQSSRYIVTLTYE